MIEGEGGGIQGRLGAHAVGRWPQQGGAPQRSVHERLSGPPPMATQVVVEDTRPKATLQAASIASGQEDTSARGFIQWQESVPIMEDPVSGTLASFALRPPVVGESRRLGNGQDPGHTDLPSLRSHMADSRLDIGQDSGHPGSPAFGSHVSESQVPIADAAPARSVPPPPV
jgi:hypothetical protein